MKTKTREATTSVSPARRKSKRATKQLRREVARKRQRRPPHDCKLSFAWKAGDPIALSIVCPFAGTVRFQHPIYLSAEAIDVDILHAKCTDDEGHGTTIDQPVPDKVRFEWTIVGETYISTIPNVGAIPNNKGRLEGPGQQTGSVMLGDQVLYYAPLMRCGDNVNVTIQCRAYNTLAAPYADSDRIGQAVFGVWRHKASPSRLEVRVDSKTSDQLNAKYDRITESDGSCDLSLTWDPDTSIGYWQSEVKIPDEICPGEEAVLYIRGFDADKLKLTCEADERTLWVNDPVTANWKAASGTFPCGGVGDSVIYRAPSTIGVDTITCTLKDSGVEAPDALITATFQIKIGWSRLLTKSQQLTQQLRQLCTQLKTAGDMRFEFLQLHSCISNGIMAKAAAGGFKDTCWILKLNILFMEKFFTAYNAYQAGQQTRADWQQVFDTAKDIQATHAKKGLTNEQATSLVTILMAAAHIFGDLAASLAEVGCGPSEDFFSIMDIIDECERSLVLGDLMKFYKDTFGNLPVFGNPGNFAIRDWRTAVFRLVCECDKAPMDALKAGN